ncbi:MAG: FkbM family methyltransferase [Cyanobacteria bacterium]|nr:FkbM family methyltransferase [Cyanobacteriota bacterium]
MKVLANRILRRFGFEIRKVCRPCSIRPNLSRDSLQGLLEQVRERGFSPSSVIDAGAACGTFSSQCHTLFPDAHYLLIEPLSEYLPSIEKVVSGISRATYEMAAVASQEGSVVFNVHHDLVGSSLYQEVEEGSDVNGVRREVRTVTLDRLVAERHVSPPYLVKIDVQGAELDVLAGGEKTLQNSEYVILEVSLFQFFKQGPVLCDVVAYMKARGFVPYDIYGLQYRPLDHALSQVDIAFVKDSGQFRTAHYYATPEQRAKQTREYKSYLEELLSREQGR